MCFLLHQIIVQRVSRKRHYRKITRQLPNKPAPFSAPNMRHASFSSLAWQSSARCNTYGTDCREILCEMRDSHSFLSALNWYRSAASSIFPVNDTSKEGLKSLSSSSSSRRVPVYTNQSMAYNMKLKAIKLVSRAMFRTSPRWHQDCLQGSYTKYKQQYLEKSILSWFCTRHRLIVDYLNFKEQQTQFEHWQHTHKIKTKETTEQLLK